VFARLKNVYVYQQNQQPPKVEAWGIYSPLGKTSHFIAVAIPDTHAGHVRYDLHCANSNWVTVMLWGVGTPDECWNSRPSELPTHVGTPDPQQIWKPCNWVKVCKVSELPTHVETPDPQGFWKLAVGLWSCIPDTYGMNTGHVRYDQDSEPSKSVKVRDVGTPDPCRNSRPSELPTYVGTPDEPTREQQ